MRALLALLLVGCAEPGFMTSRPHWSRSEVPLSVCASAYVGDSVGAQKMVRDVIGTINERLSFKLYTYAEATALECDVIAIVGAPVEAHWRDPGGDASFDPRAVAGTRCLVTTANTGTDELLFYTLEHELGHCAGLDHDDWDGSIMRRVQRPAEPMEWPPWIDDHDRALLRETYN